METDGTIIMRSVKFKDELKDLGFEDFGSGWFGNEDSKVRIRFWKGYEVDFWLWRSSEIIEDNQIHFRGEIYDIEDVKWVIDRCFKNI